MTPEEEFYNLLEYGQLNGWGKSIGRALNECSYNVGVHIMKRLASRFGYTVEKNEAYDDE